MIKTEVTTELLRPITEAFDGVLIGDLLVGFKYHANVLDHLERHGHFGTLRGTVQDFVIAVEESHGLLVTLRDPRQGCGRRSSLTGRTGGLAAR